MSEMNWRSKTGAAGAAAASRTARDPFAPPAERRAARQALAAWARRAVETAAAALDRATPALKARTRAFLGVASPEARVAVSEETGFHLIGEEYDRMFAEARLTSARLPEIDTARARVLTHRERYQAVERETGFPWWLTGVIHGLEAAHGFDRHLHNGDPLTARTARVPAGRPVRGAPPFTWEESAADAVRYMGLDRIGDWPLARQLYELERYNGFGYRHRGLPSPYLWAGTDRYLKGKYVADGVYDANAVSRQIGAAAILKRMRERGDLPL